MGTVQNSTIAFIKAEEGYKPVATYDAKGFYSIGWGNTRWEDSRLVKNGETITTARAEQLLSYWVNYYGKLVNSLVKVSLTQNQYDAVVSFAYNVGDGNFKSSTLLKLINQNPANYTAIEKEFVKWTNTARRQREANLYLSANVSDSTPMLIILIAIFFIFIILTLKKLN